MVENVNDKREIILQLLHSLAKESIILNKIKVQKLFDLHE